MSTRQTIRVTCISMMVVVLAGMMTLPAFAKKSVIRFLTDETDPKSIKVYTGMEGRFEKAYPQYDLQIEYISLSDVWPKLMASIQAKTPPEIAYLDPDVVVDLAKPGYLRDVQHLVEATGEGGASDYHGSVMRLVQQEGATYGVPPTLGIMFMMYRKDLFGEAGLTVPETWDEYLDALAKVTAGKKVKGNNLFMGQIHAIHQVLVSMWSNGGYMFGKPNGPVVLDSPENVDAVKFLQKMWEYASPGAAADTYTDAFMRFVNGEIATVWAYGRTLANVDRYNPDMAADVGAAFIPRSPTGAFRTTLFPQFLVIFKDAANIEGAEAFIKFHMIPEENIPLLASVAGHIMDPRASVGRSELFFSDPAMKKYRYALELQAQLIPYARNIAFEHGEVDYKAAKLTKSPILVDLMYDAMPGGMSAEKALAKAVQRTEELLAE
ncbi:MAG: ABC transporter substrate-binding protein [bacterium]